MIYELELRKARNRRRVNIILFIINSIFSKIDV